jgi:hypothetical protein
MVCRACATPIAHGGGAPTKRFVDGLLRKISYFASGAFMLPDADNEGQSPDCPGGGLGCITAWMDQGLPVSVGVRPVAS